MGRMVQVGSVFDYTIGADDVIVAVGDAWLRFALENGAPQLSRERVVGRGLFEFVAGDTTRELYELLFKRVRQQRRPLVLPFRCDTPERFRFMELAIAPGEGGELRLGARLLREQARPYLPLLDRLVSRGADPLPICSVCLRVEVHGADWVEAEEAVERLDLFHSAAVPPLDYRVCPDCVATARSLAPDAPRSSHGSPMPC